ncbi:host-nuclease inhibitor Gam family protein [Helicobacter trogontum]|uniref:Host-nuclease inhibitor protein Gam n=1 Tax=Helicobacter trogontum TaxID=50960 RepID=A0A099VDJ7_9HELI|nr:host-nuclease inhibitor Gam family protein [Helicobacter trogontum]TLD81322.1 host-nuclease inhibitor protein Gam [Helicobacter trogontum]
MKYNDFIDVDNELKRLCEILVNIAEIEGQVSLACNAIKEQYAERIQELNNEANFIKQEIENFCNANKAAFVDKRSKELVFGTIGYRVSKSVSLPRNKDKIESLCESIKKFGFKDCISYEEKPNKDALCELDDVALVKLGLKRVVKDNFRIEPKLESLQRG